MSHKLGRRARRAKNPLPEAPADPTIDFRAALILGLWFPLISLIPLMFGVFNNTADFVVIFAMLWIGGTVCGLSLNLPNKLHGDIIRAICGAMVGTLTAALFDAAPSGVAIAAAAGAFAAFAVPYCQGMS